MLVKAVIFSHRQIGSFLTGSQEFINGRLEDGRHIRVFPDHIMVKGGFKDRNLTIIGVCEIITDKHTSTSHRCAIFEFTKDSETVPLYYE